MRCKKLRQHSRLVSFKIDFGYRVGTSKRSFKIDFGYRAGTSKRNGCNTIDVVCVYPKHDLRKMLYFQSFSGPGGSGRRSIDVACVYPKHNIIYTIQNWWVSGCRTQVFPKTCKSFKNYKKLMGFRVEMRNDGGSVGGPFLCIRVGRACVVYAMLLLPSPKGLSLVQATFV